ncbi:MAG: START domain-containing protein [Chthoniobacterales bacterium]
MKILAALAIALPLLARAAIAEQSADWKDESDRDGVLIQSRARAGSALREFRAIGVIDAPTSRVFAVLNDAEAYPKSMPYVSEVRVLRREPDAIVFYQRLKLPLLQDRDFTLRTRFEESTSNHGTIYRMQWRPVAEGPEAIRGVLRVMVCEGGWLLEPQENSKTRATYSIYTDSGGALPSFIANSGSRIAIRKLFDALRKQVKEPKYATPD